MMTTQTNTIGLKEKSAEKLATKLNELLANFQIHYQNLRAVHWNVRGSDFFSLHVKFEEYYTDAQLSIDQIAERILTLEERPLHTYQDYIDTSVIPVAKNVSDARQSVEIVVKGYQALIAIEREVLSIAAEVGDEGTIDLLGGFVGLHEKNIWMLNAYLGK